MILSASLSCSEEKNMIVRDRNVSIEAIGESLALLKKTKADAKYGTRKGEYPEESKQILDDAMTVLARIIMRIDKGENVSDAEVSKAKADAATALENFKKTVRTETLLFPAEIYVDGNDGGYIDFGYSADYIRFGTNGNQAFTVELWVKYRTMPGGILAIVSTFVEQADGVRRGWMMNMINGDYLRMTLPSNVAHNLLEPGEGFRQTETWTHIAAVYNDKGVDGEFRDGLPVVLKFYKDGELKNSSTNNADRYYQSGDDSRFPELAMIAFAQFNPDGSTQRKMQGYIKHFHLWKSAKTADEIRKLMDGTTTVVGTESDLVCGWAFDKQVEAEDEQNMKDLTGRHTAALRGKYEWRLLQ